MEQLHIPNLSRPPRREFEEIKSYAPRRGGGVNCITLSVGSLGRPAREELSRGFLHTNPCALLNMRCGGPIGRERGLHWVERGLAVLGFCVEQTRVHECGLGAADAEQ